MFKATETRKLLTHEYESLHAFAEHQGGNPKFTRVTRDFCGVDSLAEAVERAKAGIPATGLKVLDASRPLTDAAMREVKTLEMVSTYDVAGSYVDIGRYVEGTPECMVQTMFDETPITKPVVTVVLNISAGAGVSAREIEQRGRLVVALVKAIETSGRSTELYADFTAANAWRKPTRHFRTKVCVKRPSAALDMGAVMYAFSDPSMLRGLAFNAMHEMDETWQKRMGVGVYYAYPSKDAVSVAETYGPDAVYLSSVRLGDNAERTVTRVLTELGIA